MGGAKRTTTEAGRKPAAKAKSPAAVAAPAGAEAPLDAPKPGPARQPAEAPAAPEAGQSESRGIDRDSRIKLRAYELWEREGSPGGRDRDHWRQAEAEIDEEDAGAGDAASSKAENGEEVAREVAGDAKDETADRTGRYR